MSKSYKIKKLKQDGQGVMEYIIISSLIGIFCLIAVKQFGQVIQKRIDHMKRAIVKSVPVD